jgi:hypothetical protein
LSEEPLEWVTLPLDLQHRFFELAEEEANKTLETIQELSVKLSELKRLITPHVKKLEASGKIITVAAVDGSRSPRLSERLGVRYGVFATGVVYLEGIKKKGEKFEVGPFKRKQALSQDKSKYFFDLLSTYAERKLALEALDKCDLLILDGSFYSFLYPVLRMKKAGLYGEEEEKLMKKTFEITEKLRKSGKTIGIIKRSHTRVIGGYISLKDRENPLVTIIDKLILSTFMPEQTIFHYEDLIGDVPVQVYTQLAQFAVTKNWPEENPLKEAENKVFAPFEALKLQKDGIKEMRRLQVKAYDHLPPCEVEYPSSISIKKIHEWLGQKDFFNEATNLPIALDLVDSLVGIPSKFIDEFVSEVEGRILNAVSLRKEDYEIVRLYFTLLNPQKPM